MHYEECSVLNPGDPWALTTADKMYLCQMYIILVKIINIINDIVHTFYIEIPKTLKLI